MSECVQYTMYNMYIGYCLVFVYLSLNKLLKTAVNIKKKNNNTKKKNNNKRQSNILYRIVLQ